MHPKFSFMEVVNWQGGPFQPDVGAKESFVTVVIGNSSTEFAVYDSAYPPRMPIIVSSNVSLELLGQEYVVPRLEGNWLKTWIFPLLSFIFPSRDCFITLKSPSLISPELDVGPTGQILLIVRRPIYRSNIDVIQESLNIHAQDIHSSYFKKNYGEIVISVARIMNSCNTMMGIGDNVRALNSKNPVRSAPR